MLPVSLPELVAAWCTGNQCAASILRPSLLCAKPCLSYCLQGKRKQLSGDAYLFFRKFSVCCSVS